MYLANGGCTPSHDVRGCFYRKGVLFVVVKPYCGCFADWETL
jgi:hypothetical protein